MTKLHELLAVEGQLKGQAQAVRTELRATFEKKRHLFEEKLVTFRPDAEGQPAVTETQSDLQSKVVDELAWISGIWTKALDVSAAVAEGNMAARANVTLDDGTVLLANLPATALLELEKRAGEIHELAKAIPTLDPAKGFQPDPTKGDHIFAARAVTKARTKKVQKALVLVQATVQHPAQAQLISEDIPVGTITEQEWSGLVTPAQKGDIIERAEAFARAVKQARMRANNVEVDQSTQKVGAAVFGYVFGTAK